MNNREDIQGFDEDTKARLSRIRRTINDSRALIEQVELRMKETDRFLESVGLTREQVSAMKFTDEQKEAVNAELKRRGMQPLEIDLQEEHQPNSSGMSPENIQEDTGEDMENRRRKFNLMMNDFKL